MQDFEKIRVFGANFGDFSRSVTAAISTLPKETALRVREIFRAYFAQGGFEVQYERMNDRTIAQILADADSQDVARTPIRSGTIEGVSFALYDVPEGNKSDIAENDKRG